MTGRYRKPSMDRTHISATGSSSSTNNSNTKPINNGNRDRSNSNSSHQYRDRSNSTSSYRDRSNSTSSYGGGGARRNRSSSFSHHNGPRKPQSKKDLWKGSLNKDIGNSVIVQMVGMDSDNHTVYARVDPSCEAAPEALAAVPIGKVIEIMVGEGWRHVAEDILAKGVHVETADTYPSNTQLLELGAVWLLNETLYAKGENSHARRLSPKDEVLTPDWKDMTLRVHYNPDRFFVAHEVDWSKYCRGLLLDNCTSAVVGGKRAHVPVAGMPDGKDGVIVYEDNETGFAVVNKPGGMPCHSTISNHAEDVGSMFGAALKERTGNSFLSLPLRVEPEVHGLLLAATKKEFCAYTTKQLDIASKDTSQSNPPVVTKTYRCLVCIKDPDDIDRIEKMVHRIIEHHVDVRSPTPKTFVRNKPKHPGNHDWAHCLMKITSVGQGSNSGYRAACVSSKYSDSNDFTLAHRLWGPNMHHPAEDVGAQYVMQVDVQLLNAKLRPHQIRGQLAALGIPIVGDAPYGGGTCEMRMHRHLWTRMAVQICHLEFTLPQWEEKEDSDEEKKGTQHRALVPASDEEQKKCVFHLNTAWWSEYLVDYERNSLPGAMASVSVQ